MGRGAGERAAAGGEVVRCGRGAGEGAATGEGAGEGGGGGNGPEQLQG